MATSQFTLDELLAIVGHTYRSIDIRVAAVREGDAWINSVAFVRFSHLTPMETHENGATARLETANFRIETEVRPFSDLPQLREAAAEGHVRAKGTNIRLRQNVDWARLRAGDPRPGGDITMPSHGERWPGVEVTHGQSTPHLLHDPSKQREVSVYGYGSPYEAVATLCEANVWPSTSHSSELYLWFPVFGALDEALLSLDRQRLEVRIRRHAALADLYLSAVLTSYGGIGVPRRAHGPVDPGSGSDTAIETATSTLSLPSNDLNDLFEMRLAHKQLGEVARLSRFTRELLPRAQVNPMLEALKRFCDEAELRDLLLQPWLKKDQSKKHSLQPSSAFEEHVTWLLSALGFSAIRLGAHERLRAPESKIQRGSVDILAAREGQNELLLVSCTLGPLNTQDLTNIRSVCAVLRREVFSNTAVNLSGILVTAAQDASTFEGVGIIDGDRLKEILDLVFSGQEQKAAAHFCA